ncbi:MAG: hypothetical protein M3O30_17475 [Planctomycetota bacterium]|nr:hypothetical protein [Planctomycetota bacterium]
MGIKFLPDAEVVADERLTIVQVIKALQKPYLPDLVTAIKSDLIEKDAVFAESDLVRAHLRGGDGDADELPRFPDAAKLHKLVKSGKITLKQFLNCVTVRGDALEKLLPPSEIDNICSDGAPTDPGAGRKLYTEFKPGVAFDYSRLEAALTKVMKLSAAA